MEFSSPYSLVAERAKFMNTFTIEVFHLLDSCEVLIEELPHSDTPLETIETLLRALHTMKKFGEAFDYPSIVTITKESNTLLNTIGHLPFTQNESVANLLYETFEILRALFALVEHNHSDRAVSVLVPQLVEQLQQTVQCLSNGKDGQKPLWGYPLGLSSKYG